MPKGINPARNILSFLIFLMLWAVLRSWRAGKSQTTPLATLFLMLCFKKWWHVTLGPLWRHPGHWEGRLAVSYGVCRFCVGPWLCGEWNSELPVVQLGPRNQGAGWTAASSTVAPGLLCHRQKQTLGQLCCGSWKFLEAQGRSYLSFGTIRMKSCE